jgi:DNA-directed RNA polymerase subunit H
MFKGGAFQLLALDPMLERKMQVLIELRGYRQLGREDVKSGALITVEDSEGKRFLIWAVSAAEAIGIKYINQMAKYMKSKNIESGIIVGEKYTQSARSLARRKNIELIPQDFPSFNIFKHYLVPKHEVLSPEERKEVLEKYRVEPYKLPHIKTSDPIVRVIGAKPGDIIKITRRSPTAGEYVYYRYVVEG